MFSFHIISGALLAVLYLFDKELYYIDSRGFKAGPETGIMQTRKKGRLPVPTVPVLTASLYVEEDYFGYCTIISDKQHMGFFHKHNYYEAFLVIDGSATHYVNGESYNIEKGSLWLIRPDDEHCYLDPISSDYQFINFILTQELLQAMLDFLGPGFSFVVGADHHLPLSRTLSGPDLDKAIKTLENLMLYPKTDVGGFNATFKIAAIEVLNCFFSRSDKYGGIDLPGWLRCLIAEMRKEENYTLGLQAMLRISQYSPEHLCRTFRKYLGTSPTAFLSTIRLEEAARRLIYSDEDIISIASSVGFDNLSYFYRRFKEWHGLSPRKYREMSRNVPFAKSPLASGFKD